MFRALLRKEWTQLRALRWVGVILGLLLPPFLLAAAEAATRGWMPYGRISSYTVDGLFRNALPGLLVGLWGLLALLVTAQAFAGDRAAGTERFLLERPVPRPRVWWARLLAAFWSLAALVLAHSILWLVLARSVTASPWDPWRGGAGLLVTGGAPVLAVGLVAGILAASLVNSPIQAILLALVLAAIPPGLSTFLGGLSPLAMIGLVPLGMIVPWLLLPGYLAASYAICCRGEPAGRGRLRRGLGVLGVCFFVVPVLFLAGVPWALRAGAKDFAWPELVAAEGGGQTVCVIDNSWPLSSGWLIDPQRARKLRFLPPPVQTAAWNRSGSLLALAHEAGRFGGYAGGAKISFFDEGGEPAGPDVRFRGEELGWVRGLRWVDDRLVAAVQLASRSAEVLIIDPASGAVRRVPVAENAQRWELVGPTEAGELFVFVLEDREDRRHVLRRLDPVRAVVEAEPLLEVRDVPTWGGRWISPSGRYWMMGLEGDAAGFRLIGLEGGEELPLAECLWARWMTGERLACLEAAGDGRRLTVGSPGAHRTEIGAWPASSVMAEVSPDGGRVLVQVWDPPHEPDDPGGSDDHAFWSRGQGWRVGPRLRQVLVYEDASGAVSELTSRWGRAGPAAGRPAAWAGPQTLALAGHGVLAFADLERNSAPRYVFGRP